MGLMQELNLKPGVIYGEDVLNVRFSVSSTGFLPPQAAILTIRLALQLRPEEGIRHPCRQRYLVVNSVSFNARLPLPASFTLHMAGFPVHAARVQQLTDPHTLQCCYSRGCQRLQIAYHPTDFARSVTLYPSRAVRRLARRIHHSASGDEDDVPSGRIGKLCDDGPEAPFGLLNPVIVVRLSRFIACWR